MSSSKVVYTHPVNVTQKDLEDIIPYLNRDCCSQQPLTIEELVGNEELLKYVCAQAVECDGLFDPQECWNNDGWCDWEEHR